MKKTILIISLLAALLFILTACGGGEHTHEWGEWQTERDATCTRTGLDARVCECGEREEREVEKAAHSFGEWEVIEAASCTMWGERARECACGEREEEDLAPLGHTFGEWETVREVDCTNDGISVRECACGERERATTPAPGHSFGKWVTVDEPSCTEDGLRVRRCECGEEDEDILPSPGHAWGDWTVTKEPTYLEGGTREHACPCGVRESENTPPLEPLFEDNFDGTELNSENWDFSPEWERAGGDSVWDDGMTSLDGEGNLVLGARWDEVKGRVVCGSVRTQGLFSGGYGYYEARIRFPVCKGIWGAFWLICGDMGATPDGSAADGIEIDIIESIRNEKGGYNNALHFDGYGEGLTSVTSGTMYDVDIYDGSYHTFAVERTEEGYTFFIDGAVVWSASAEECDPCPLGGYIILSVEGATWAGSGTEESIDALPCQMLIDYVRVYPENPYVEDGNS